MEIQVNEDIRICSTDPLNYTVEKRRIVKSGPNAGKPQWDVLGYHGNLESCARALLRQHINLIKQEQAATIQDMLDLIEDWGSAICAACKVAAPILADRDASVKKARTPVVG